MAILNEKSSEKIASLCCIYGIDFRNFTEEHELGTEKDLNGKAFLALSARLYRALRDLIDNEAHHAVFRSNIMKDMANVFR